jgi:hypothetical protein
MQFIKKNSTRIALALSFIAMEAVLFVLVIFFGHGKWAEYSSILIALTVALIFFEKTPRGFSIPLGMLFTAAADLCLVILSPARDTLGVVFFLVTTLSYAALLYLEEPDARVKKYHIYVRASLSLLLIGGMFAVLGKESNFLSFISCFYFANLLSSIILSFAYGKSKIFSAGLLLFALCDLFVGLSVLTNDYLAMDSGSILYRIANPPFNAVWLFYIPSQTLIVLSLIFKRVNPKREV